MTEPTQLNAGDAAAKPKKTFREILLTTTPVILTVVGTLLAGISSSEMTLAQYFRTLAAQSQSKAAGQWEFFQVKRTRRTTLEATLDLMPLPAPPGPLDPELLLAQAERLLSRFRHARQAGDQFQSALDKSDWVKGLPDVQRNRLQALATAIPKVADEAQKEAVRAAETLQEELKKDDTKTAIQLVQAGRVPEVAIRPIGDASIHEVIQSIHQPVLPANLVQIIVQIKSADLEEAIHASENNYHDVDKAAGSISKVLGRLAKPVTQQVVQARTLHRAVLAAENALPSEPAPTEKGPSSSLLPLIELQRADREVLAAATELLQGIKAAEHHYTDVRYKAEGEYNLKSAQLYEVQVRKHSLTSERHRARSRLFFYAMLSAQAGVAIASLSLAGRQPRMLWSLAVTAGLSALGFSTYVYLFI